MAKKLLKREHFTSKFGILAAAAGSAIGLGNVWKFPYITGVYGGGAFLLFYLFFIIAIGLPVMLSEFLIGRKAQKNAFGSFKELAPGSKWYIIGIMGVAAAYVILAFYSTVAAWIFEYVYLAFTNAFEAKSAAEINTLFNGFISQTYKPIIWQLLFLVLTALIVIAGVKKGIEKYSKILMPLLLVLIIALDIRAITLPGAKEGLEFLFKPDFSKISPEGILSALGHAFFSLSLGMGTLVTYGSYIKKQDNLVNTAIQVSAADTIIALLAGIAIFPAVFAFNIDPTEGEGLIFITLPGIFNQIPGGYIFSLIFFILLAIAALTSAISILEVVVAFLSEELKFSRKKATILATSTVAVFGILCTLSFGELSDFKILGVNVFNLFDNTASNYLLPLGGLLITVFIGWVYKKSESNKEITNDGSIKVRYLPYFRILVKFFAPIAIAIVFAHGLGLIKF